MPRGYLWSGSFAAGAALPNPTHIPASGYPREGGPRPRRCCSPPERDMPAQQAAPNPYSHPDMAARTPGFGGSSGRKIQDRRRLRPSEGPSIVELACKFCKAENTKDPTGPDGQKLGGNCAAGGSVLPGQVTEASEREGLCSIRRLFVVSFMPSPALFCLFSQFLAFFFFFNFSWSPQDPGHLRGEGPGVHSHLLPVFARPGQTRNSSDSLPISFLLLS